MLAALKCVDTPIELPHRQELTLIAHGKTHPLRQGGPSYDYVVLSDPEVVAQTIWEKKRRKMLEEINIRRFS